MVKGRTFLDLAVAALVLTVVEGSAVEPGQTRPVAPEDPASGVHPRRFGHPGGLGKTRGWYIWHKLDARKGIVEVSNEASGARYTVRVLPWATTYRHLVYGANPDELIPGERVNLFFEPDEKQQRGYLVHFQDELGQMKGHGHVWQVQTVTDDGRGFTARVLAGKKPLDGKALTFRLDPKVQHWRDGKAIKASPRPGELLYLTWAYQGERKVVHLTADDASLNAVKQEEQNRVAARLGKEGLGAFVEAVEKDGARLLIFPTYWAQAGRWKEGQTLAIRDGSAGKPIPAIVLSRKNLGAYGSGATEVRVRLNRTADAERLRSWLGGKIVRLIAN